MISVIVPVYNSEQYLEQCIESVLNSRYQDFELILVNDGSKDGSSEICWRYSEKDCRIKWINQEHTGVSAARNRGIEECCGEWVVFVDSDDFISKYFLERTTEERYQQYDLLIFDFLRLKQKTKKATDLKGDCGKEYQYISEDRLYLIESFLTGIQLDETGSMSLLSLWAKAYKKSVLEKYAIRFPTELMLGEDRIFNLEYLTHIQSCVYIRERVYFAEMHPNSVMHKYNPRFLQNDFRYQVLVRKYLRRYGILPSVKQPYYNSVLSCMADVLIRGIFHPCSPRERYENCSLCKKMRRYGIYKRALRYNGKTGVIPRRILLFFFRKQCWGIVMLISKACYRILDMAEEL